MSYAPISVVVQTSLEAIVVAERLGNEYGFHICDRWVTRHDPAELQRRSNWTLVACDVTTTRSSRLYEVKDGMVLIESERAEFDAARPVSRWDLEVHAFGQTWPFAVAVMSKAGNALKIEDEDADA